MLIGGADVGLLPPDRHVDADAPPGVETLPPNQAYRVREYVRQAERALPILRNAEIAQIRSGLPTFTADLRFIVDSVPGYAGLLVATGCQEAGVRHGPAIGRKLVMRGTPRWDRERFRLAPQAVTDPTDQI